MIQKTIAIHPYSLDEEMVIYDQPNYGFKILNPFSPGTFSISIDGGSFIPMTIPMTIAIKNSALMLKVGGLHGTVPIAYNSASTANITIFETEDELLHSAAMNPVCSVMIDIGIEGTTTQPIFNYDLVVNGGYTQLQHEHDGWAGLRFPFRFQAMKILRWTNEASKDYYPFIFPVYNTDLIMPDFDDPPNFAVFDMIFPIPQPDTVNAYFGMDESSGTTSWRNLAAPDWPGDWRIRPVRGHAFNPLGSEIVHAGIGRRMTHSPTGFPVYGNGFNTVICMAPSAWPPPPSINMERMPIASVLLFYTYRNSLSALI